MTISNSDRLAGFIIIVKKTGWVIFFLFSFIVMYQLVQLWVSTRENPGEAPDFQASTLSGESFVLHETRGKPVLLHFWGTWCRICRLEHHSITQLAKDYQVMTVAIQSGSDTEIQNHMSESGAVYPVINDRDGELMYLYGIRGVPNSFIIDPQGDIDTALKGYTSEVMLRYRLWRLQP